MRGGGGGDGGEEGEGLEGEEEGTEGYYMYLILQTSPLPQNEINGQHRCGTPTCDTAYQLIILQSVCLCVCVCVCVCVCESGVLLTFNH